MAESPQKLCIWQPCNGYADNDWGMAAAHGLLNPFAEALAPTLRCRQGGTRQNLVIEGRKMAKYGSTSKKEVKGAMNEYKRGKLKSGKSGKPVKNRKQAIAIGLSKARKKGGKVPAKSKS
jgi:hypothetical protein